MPHIKKEADRSKSHRVEESQGRRVGGKTDPKIRIFTFSLFCLFDSVTFRLKMLCNFSAFHLLKKDLAILFKNV